MSAGSIDVTGRSDGIAVTVRVGAKRAIDVLVGVFTLVVSRVGRSALADVDRLELDRPYVEGWSLRGDVALLAQTPLAVLQVSRAH